jgi:hypothetical protein
VKLVRESQGVGQSAKGRFRALARRSRAVQWLTDSFVNSRGESVVEESSPDLELPRVSVTQLSVVESPERLSCN